jgi:hypothetical protein
MVFDLIPNSEQIEAKTFWTIPQSEASGCRLFHLKLISGLPERGDVKIGLDAKRENIHRLRPELVDCKDCCLIVAHQSDCRSLDQAWEEGCRGLEQLEEAYNLSGCAGHLHLVLGQISRDGDLIFVWQCCYSAISKVGCVRRCYQRDRLGIPASTVPA